MTQSENDKKFQDLYSGLVYIVVDVESDGCSPKYNSAFAYGGVAIRAADKKVLGRFAYNVKPREGTKPETRCWEEFWSKNRQMWDFLHNDSITEDEAALKMREFVKHFSEYKVEFVTDCSVYDFKWVDNLLVTSNGSNDGKTVEVNSNPFGYTALDIYSLAAGALKVPRYKVWKVIETMKKMNVLDTDGIDHDHDPFNDALQEACLIVDLERLNFGASPLKLDCDVRFMCRPHNNNLLL
jgi:hypothetical protein